MSTGTSRIAVTLPAAGAFASVPVSGRSVIVEYSPDNTRDGVPLIRIDSQGGSVFPAYTGSQFRFAARFQRLFIEGTAAASGTLYLLILNGPDVQVQFPATSTI